MKRYTFRRLSLLAVLLVATTSACGPGEPWAAKVNGEVIPASTVHQEMKAVTSNAEFVEFLNQAAGQTGSENFLQPNGDNTISAGYTAQIVSGRLISALVDQELTKRGLTVGERARAQAETLFRQQYPDPTLFDRLDPDYRSYLVGRVSGLLVLLEGESTIEKQQAYYVANPEQFTTSCVRHILVATEQQASSIRSRIVAGEDFAAIAQTESLDSDPTAGSASKGGDLGCFGADELESLVDPFRDAVRSLAVNEVSDPVVTDYGYHLVQVTSRQVKPFEEVRQQVAQALGDPGGYVERLLEKARIEVNPRYGVYTPSNPAAGEGPSIRPYRPAALQDSGTDPEPADQLPGMGGR